MENEDELFSNCTYIKENICVEESFLEAFKDEVESKLAKKIYKITKLLK